MASKNARRSSSKSTAFFLFFILLVAIIAGALAIQNRKTYRSEAKAGGTCKKILFIGDSLMPITAQYTERALKEKGYCVRAVIPQGSGTGSAIGSTVGVDWHKTLPRLLDSYKPDILVGEFAGNNILTGIDRGSAKWHELSQQGVLNLVNEAEKRTIKTYWIVPPKIQWACNSNHYYQRGLDDFRLWVRNQLPLLEPQLQMLDWSSVISPGDVYTDSLTIDGQEITVRTKADPLIGADCIHFTHEGSKLVAAYTAENLEKEWNTGGSKKIRLVENTCNSVGASCCEYKEEAQRAVHKEYAPARTSLSGYYYYYCNNKLICQNDLACNVYNDLYRRHPWAKGKNAKPL